MPMDINQFLKTFIEESFELLGDMEEALITFKIESPDPEKINCIFRTAHSLKSSSNVFGLNDISGFAHTLEDYLDTVRTEAHQLDQRDIEYLLKSVDCIREALKRVQNNQAEKSDCLENLNSIFHELLKQAPCPPSSGIKEKNPARTPLKKTIKKQTGWKIHYHPRQDSFLNNNEPSRLFDVLSSLIITQIEMDDDDLPLFAQLDPTQCYLRWTIHLNKAVSKNQIEEILEWSTNKDEVDLISVDEESAQEKASEPAATVKKSPEGPKKSAIPETAASSKGTPSSIRVGIDKIDDLMNIVGELVIAQSALSQIMHNFDIRQLEKLVDGFNYLEQNSRRLQDSIMRIRMIPIENIFKRFPRAVHDLANQLGKKIELNVFGENTELDKTVIEKIADPLLHLIRNAVDHGIETPAVREKLGKSATGVIRLEAYQENGNIIICISDDGAGIDLDKVRSHAIERGLISDHEELTNEEIIRLIMQPGFSTAETVTSISGRGVGMNVVQKNIVDLGGDIDMQSEKNVGTIMKLRLPLTLAIMDCQLVKIGGQVFIFPLIAITEIIQIDSAQLTSINEKELYCLHQHYIPIIKINKIFNVPVDTDDLSNKFLIVVERDNQFYGLLCDETLSQRQIVIKNIEDNYQKIPGIAGATILSDDSTALIVDVNAIIDIDMKRIPIKIEAENETEVIEDQQASHPNHDAALLNGLDQYLPVLGFVINEHEYGVDMQDIMEICLSDKITPLPNVSSYIKGMMNLRGMLIPIIDLLEWLSFEKSTDQSKVQKPIITLYIKSKTKQRIVGFMVDALSDTYQVNHNQIRAIPASVQSVSRNKIRGLVHIENKIITLLSVNNLLLHVNE